MEQQHLQREDSDLLLPKRRQRRRGASLRQLAGHDQLRGQLPCARPRRREPLLVLALLVALFGLALPAAQRAGEFANRLKCQNNLKQLDLATIICSDTNASTLPPSVGAYPNADSDGTLFFHILPYLEQDNV